MKYKLRLCDLFNETSVCIFTDSSFRKNDNCSTSYIGTAAPAYCVYHNNVCIDKGFQLIYDATSVQGELHALLLGIRASARYKNYTIRLFSDNQTAICAVRDWIFNWVKETHSGKATLGPKGRIKNQPLIINIIQCIMYNNIPIELYHVKGHVNVNIGYKLNQAKQMFLTNNYLNIPAEFVDDQLIQALAIGNNDVDQYSTEMLKMYYFDPNFKKMNDLIQIGFKTFDLNKYSTLINSKNGYY